jgi:hypothetical protein
MLPALVSFQRHGHFLNHYPRSLTKLLRAPAHLTNLSAFILALLLAFSILLDLRSCHGSVAALLIYFRSIVGTLPKRPVASSDLDHLVIVPGHAIWIGVSAEDAEKEDAWLLYPSQKGCVGARPCITHT